jgi:hypothetical protein
MKAESVARTPSFNLQGMLHDLSRWSAPPVIDLTANAASAIVPAVRAVVPTVAEDVPVYVSFKVCTGGPGHDQNSEWKGRDMKAYGRRLNGAKGLEEVLESRFRSSL